MSWQHPPPNYADHPDQRGPPPDGGHQQNYPPQGSFPPPAPPIEGRHPGSRDGPSNYPPLPESTYSRQGSVSAPARSPAESHTPRYPPPGPHEPPYYSQPGVPDYHRPPYGHEPQVNGTHQPLHVQTGAEMMPGPPGGPPPPPPHHYGPPPPLAQPPPTPGGGGYYPYYDNSQQRRKPVRAAQACDSCRTRKAKCDEGRPVCQHCKDNGLNCSYREIPPQKSEKQVLAITERLEGLVNNVTSLLNSQKTTDERINKILEAVSRLEGGQSGLNHPGSAHSHPAQLPNEGSQAQADQNDRAEDESAKFAMPLKHTTAVHHLFEWPSIKVLLPKNISHTYVNDLEISRGLLRFFGCGEGEDKGDGHEGAPSPAPSSSSEGRRGDEDTSSASPHGVWGNGQLPPAPTSNEDRSVQEHPGGLSPLGGLMLDSAAVDAYFRSYMDNMHILHPFLEPKILRQMVHAFKKKYSWDYRHKLGIVGGKRKREPTDSPTPKEEMDTSPPFGRNALRPGAAAVSGSNIEHSVANAIVLLVMALGKVCAHRQPLPAPASTTSMTSSTPHMSHSVFSGDLPPAKSAPTSPFNHAHLNGHGAVGASSPSNPQGKNMDLIPGLSYFAVAAGILGELPGGNDVSHIQANLLSGLYMGQLARIVPSLHYISAACRACQILIESTDYKNNSMRPARRNLINFAFWSCLQLESDILAEVDLPPSGITRFESLQHAEMPTGVTLEQIPESAGQEDILRFYSYQIQLRRTMNEIHSALYKKKAGEQKNVISLMEVLNDNIESWRHMLNDWQWSDDDHQSENINVARMRAKYYGAKYIIHRPALYQALRLVEPTRIAPTPGSKYSDSPDAFPSPSQAAYSPSGQGRRSSEMGPPSRGPAGKMSSSLLAAARQCVEAAVRSTTAFDKVPPRVIITNIFGTAHA
jgi:hypothetical protein